MNPVLVGSIRHRMREQTTEHLLELWTTNDRATWSPEAFEAVKSLLAERGVRELPRQNEPAPIAQTHSPAEDPAARYWLAWLRPVLWICAAVGAAWVPTAVIQIGSLMVAVGQKRITPYEFWNGRTLSFALDSILRTGILPLLLLIGALGALALKPWSRVVLLTYIWGAIVVNLAMVPLRLFESRFNSPAQVWLIIVPMVLGSFAQGLALPMILWVVLRRREIRSLFRPVESGSAFEPLPAGTALWQLDRRP